MGNGILNHPGWTRGEVAISTSVPLRAPVVILYSHRGGYMRIKISVAIGIAAGILISLVVFFIA